MWMKSIRGKFCMRKGENEDKNYKTYFYLTKSRGRKLSKGNQEKVTRIYKLGNREVN